MFLIGKSGLCIFHRHFFADRMHNWLFPLFLLGIFILLHSKKNRLVGIFLNEYRRVIRIWNENTGEHLCLKFHFLFGFPYVKQTD